jgi:hypothetical protein
LNLFTRRDLPKQPIIFDFAEGTARRAEERPARLHDLVDVLVEAARRVAKPRIVRTVEGIPPDVVTQPQPKR